MRQHFKFKPSRYLAAMLIVSHGAALAVLPALALPVWAKLALVFLLLVSLIYHLWRDAWLAAPASGAGLLLDREGAILITRAGEQLPARIFGNSLVTPYLTVVNVLPQRARWLRSLVILQDSLDADSFRQLRVWLKWNDAGRS